MKDFKYIITDREGIHARPAGELVKLAMKFDSDIKIRKGDKVGDAKRIFSIMALDAKQGTEIKVSVEGHDEGRAFIAIRGFIEKNM